MTKLSFPPDNFSNWLTITSTELVRSRNTPMRVPKTMIMPILESVFPNPAEMNCKVSVAPNPANTPTSRATINKLRKG